MLLDRLTGGVPDTPVGVAAPRSLAVAGFCAAQYGYSVAAFRTSRRLTCQLRAPGAHMHHSLLVALQLPPVSRKHVCHQVTPTF
jgi:hypothetical protein